MIGYIAFLRGINVGGQKIIKMEDLKKMFISFGMGKVKTYIQSGNIIFESSDSDIVKLTLKIEKKLGLELGYEVTVILRTLTEVESILKQNPFKTIKPGEDEKLYVTFMYEEPKLKPKLPLFSTKEDVEVFQIKKLDAFSISRKKNGSFGFPNAVIEKTLKVAATTRNWSTVNKIVDLANA